AGTLGDLAERPAMPPAWSPDGRTIYFQVARHGQTTLNAIDVESAELRTIAGENGAVGAFSPDQNGSKVAYFWERMATPGELWLKELDGDPAHQQPRQLTHFNDDLMAGLEFGQIEEVWFKGGDGNDLQGWIITPPGFDPARQYPSILQIHGGPWLQYGQAFMHEFFYLAGRGYVVYFCNPRGGQGYGEAHSQAIDGVWGTADYADVMAWTDLVATRPYIDKARMGVTGGSYGGYLTTWIIGHTGRFQAAVVQRVVSNPVSFVGSSDVNWLFYDIWAAGRGPWADLETYWRQAPIAFIGNTKTPTLVLHSEQDWRTPQEQVEQLYVALKKLGVETELVLFPEEAHGLSRDGRTDRRVARLQHILRWFDHHLKGSS
ncbi:MAG: S9 family peptidase, partial [Chloroflexi bacterium]|nr:S9 family peptidase [Chloroflexota bacterium]